MRKQGFTLIELLVTMVIIGTLVSAASVSFLSAQRNSRDNNRRTTASAIAQAVEAYRFANQKYPGDLSAGKSVNETCQTGGVFYYNPGNTCSTPTTDSLDFGTATNWIPGLSQYLNPPAVERSYHGANGTSAASDIAAFDSNSNGVPTGNDTNKNRTYSYVKTTTGYAIHVRLESPAISTSTTPNSATSNVYAITK